MAATVMPVNYYVVERVKHGTLRWSGHVVRINGNDLCMRDTLRDNMSSGRPLVKKIKS